MSDNPLNSDIAGESMSVNGSLRDRIAAVLYERTMSRLSWHRSWADLHSDVQGLWLDDADAVIAALGLEVEYGMAGQHDYSDKPEIHPVSKDELKYRTWYGEDFTYRYVTEWALNAEERMNDD